MLRGCCTRSLIRVRGLNRVLSLACHFLTLRPQMFPAVISTKLEAAIEREEERKRKEIEQGKNTIIRKGTHAKKGTQLSELELLVNDYSRIEADEIAVRLYL